MVANADSGTVGAERTCFPGDPVPQACSPQVGPARFRAPELLFQPDLVGDESEGLHEVLAFAIHKSDMDLRRTLFSNIVLSGGSTLFKGTVGEMVARPQAQDVWHLRALSGASSVPLPSPVW